LAYFRLSKAPIGYIPALVIEEHKTELKAYDAERDVVRFPLDKKIPKALAAKLARAGWERMRRKVKLPRLWKDYRNV
jgi:hypothetical protein